MRGVVLGSRDSYFGSLGIDAGQTVGVREPREPASRTVWNDLSARIREFDENVEACRRCRDRGWKTPPP